MGDTGSLALGALLAVIALVIKQEFLLIIFGAVFVIETLCVMIQIGSVKLFKRRVFKYTPIHYAFTLSGWKETRVVTMFWIVGILFTILGLIIGAQ
jgi:phospho-N-acetylmuramoyl-pentapeptide-transferase